RDAGFCRNEPDRKMISGDTAHNGLSTARGKSGIMMNVHVEVRVEDEDAQPQSLSSSSHEQCPETSHLEESFPPDPNQPPLFGVSLRGVMRKLRNLRCASDDRKPWAPCASHSGLPHDKETTPDN